MKKFRWTQLLIFIVAVQVIGGLSALLAGDIKGDYNMLVQPPLAPPDWLFGVMWPLLYVLMAVAAYLVWQQVGTFDNRALKVFGAQLALNFAWSIVFFRFDMLWAAVAVIVVLDVLVAWCILLFRKIKEVSGWLLVPYLLWILFATYLNIGFALLN